MRRPIRGLVLSALALLLGGAVGCSPNKWVNRNEVPAPRFAGTPTAEQLVTHLNQNAQPIQSFEALDMRIDVQHGLQSLSVSGMLQYQKPRNFRLVAELASSTQADIGSNDKEFWFWFKRADPPTLYHCAYDDFAGVRNVNLPVHPDWIAEALCVQELPSTQPYQVRAVGGQVEMVTNTTSPQGQPLQKIVTVAVANANNLTYGRVTGLRLRTAQGQDVWAAEIIEYQNLRGYVVPKVVKVKCPTEKLELTLRMNGCRVNNLVAGKTENSFVRPVNYQAIDLARGPGTPSSIQRVRGAAP